MKMVLQPGGLSRRVGVGAFGLGGYSTLLVYTEIIINVDEQLGFQQILKRLHKIDNDYLLKNSYPDGNLLDFYLWAGVPSDRQGS
jgi:hypothetical protein